ncbi:4F2 cell-surface antigen heavy chain [Gopherus flavomarginatus]|uniref:4F2 cell-surface antigen heavy chain n=1 Tax=Gopherus flavomarginatus TaxID=286002 RepID=UPI0021CBC565|nr:4F2 cell-surface antigen heavy chain [Gopherus flavomarginatus]XP_050816770.1 4F2 cell-surface antigen heavy chain [Gopherus flavomarginatus]XP_050816771.1 4F2 cell-surface antigen heavy chain [Gopherus flavomarginatus]XP_050816772.1 4F2 cell-surface antigen heavy chain [Gopherus flavomarginatus]
MSQDAEVDMKEVELNEMEPEKQPMAGSPASGSLGEKNGMVKVKVPEEDGEVDAGTKFTGLSKEELLQVAGTPGWVRTRWALLILFWLGWLGMLAGAIVIIVQAPRCKELPPQEWWHKGGIYRIQALEAFQDSDADGVGDLAGVEQHIDYLSSLKVKGLVIGPIHVNTPDKLASTDLREVDPRFGTKETFTKLLEAAKKKGLKVILDMTPNYRGQMPWFSQETLRSSDFQSKMKVALEFWLEFGVAGIQMEEVEKLSDSQLLVEWKNLTSQYSSDGNARVLIAGTGQRDSWQIFSLLNETDADLLVSPYLVGLGQEPSGEKVENAIREYIQASGEKWPSWSAGGPRTGHMASLVKERLLRLYHMLLFTLPGTPFTNYGDEIGLQELPGQSSAPHMLWNDSANFGFSSKSLSQGVGGGGISITVKAQSEDRSSLLSLFRHLSELRGKERSLLHGEFMMLPRVVPDVCIYLRSWDQNKRFLVVLNLAGNSSSVPISHSLLPPEATVELSTDPQRQEGQLALKDLTLKPSEGLLLHFPYVA